MSPQPSLLTRRSRLFLILAAFVGFIAAVFTLLRWALGWLTVTFGYQSNDANLPTVLVLSLPIFATLIWLSPSRAAKRARKRLKRW